MKVAFIAQPIDRMTRTRASSVALWIRHVARLLRERGHDAMVIGNDGGWLRADAMQQAGVRYVLTPTLINSQINRIGRGFSKLRARAFGGGSYVQAGWYHSRFGVLAAEAAATEAPDVIHVMNYSQLLPSLRQRNPRATLVLHMHCEWLSQCSPKVVGPRLEHADLIIGCSDHITDLIANTYPEHAGKCSTVPNAAEVVPEALLATASTRRILFVGRLSPEKGVHDLIAAFRAVLERFPDASLHLVGASGSVPLEYLVELSGDANVRALTRFYGGRREGTGKDRYMQTLERLAGPELGRRIFFDGYVDHDHVRDHYRRAAVLVNASLSESFGVSVVEGMMSGLPVVATRVGGMQETVVDGETGLLVSAGSPDELADAIGRLLANVELARKLGAAGRDRALRHFTWEHAVSRLLRAYERMLTRAVPT